jgi:hypothetical protein
MTKSQNNLSPWIGWTFLVFALLIEVLIIRIICNYLSNDILAYLLLFVIILTFYSLFKFSKNNFFAFIFLNNLFVGILLGLLFWYESLTLYASSYDHSYYYVFIGFFLIIFALIAFFNSSSDQHKYDEKDSELIILEKQKKNDEEKKFKQGNAWAIALVGIFLISNYYSRKYQYEFMIICSIITYITIIAGFPYFIQNRINRNSVSKNYHFQFYYFLIWYLVGTWILLEFLFSTIFHSWFLLDPHIDQYFSFFWWIAIPSTFFSFYGTVNVIYSIFFSTENKGIDFLQKAKFAYIHFLEMRNKDTEET